MRSFSSYDEFDDSVKQHFERLEAQAKEHYRQAQEPNELLGQAREAIETYKKQHSSLYAGKFPKFPEVEHEERINHYRSERNRVLRTVQERARELYQETTAEADRAGEASVADILQGDARREANELLPLVDAEVSGLGGAPLLRRLQHVARNGSRAEQFAYLIAARKRARSSDASETLRYALAELEREATGEVREKARARHSERLEMLNGILDLCYLGINDANSVMGVLSKRHSVAEHASQSRQPSHSGGQIARG